MIPAFSHDVDNLLKENTGKETSHLVKFLITQGTYVLSYVGHFQSEESSLTWRDIM